VHIVDRGSGPPLVLIPGLQGRWEYMRATVDALSAFFRVITFSLGQGDFDSYAHEIDDALSAAGVNRAIVCGVSFGGLIAVRFAGRFPARTEMLVLASTPRPALTLRRRHQIYLKAPWLLGPIFLAETPLRVSREVKTAIADAAARRRFAWNALRTLVSAPVSLGTMAARARLVTTDAVVNDCARISVPTLVLTGEAHLDYVVPVEGANEYMRLIPHASRAVLPATGHLGSITRPAEFAALVRDFVERHRHAAA
jgi:pimeloyl-ACP methyl ester carboxylesterase